MKKLVPIKSTIFTVLFLVTMMYAGHSYITRLPNPYRTSLIRDLPVQGDASLQCKGGRDTRGNRRTVRDILDSPSHRYILSKLNCFTDKSHFTQTKGKKWNYPKKKG